VAYVELGVERFIVYPVGKIGVERHFYQPLAQVWRQVRAFIQRLDHPFETNDAVRSCRRIINCDRSDMLGCVWGFSKQERCVKSG
jgi:hypothetical protein